MELFTILQTVWDVLATFLIVATGYVIWRVYRIVKAADDADD
jgi:hypothetical protein